MTRFSRFMSSIFGVVVIASVLYSVIALRPYFVSWDSMYPTLLHGHIIIVDRIIPKFSGIHRSDLIVYESDNGARIKRVIGLPQEILILDAGHITIGDAVLAEPYLPSTYDTCVPGSCINSKIVEYQVPDSSYFVLGDNRENSYDSRWCRDNLECAHPEPFFVWESDIIGKVFFQIPWLTLSE